MTSFKEIIDSETPVLVDFFCRVVRPMQDDVTHFERNKIEFEG